MDFQSAAAGWPTVHTLQRGLQAVTTIHAPGVRRESVPIPPDDEVTTYVDAGSLRLGLEYRVVTDAALRDHYGADAKSAELLETSMLASGAESFADEGQSLHVFVGADEFLRFDDFGDNPHYHYITPRSHHYVVAHDAVANGGLLRWSLGVLRGRWREMLTNAGVADVDALATEEEWVRALDQIEALWLEGAAQARGDDADD